jgi:hypothetical protein
MNVLESPIGVDATREAEARCHFCGNAATGQTSTHLYPATTAKKEEIHALFSSAGEAAMASRRIHSNGQGKGYYQSVTIPRCEACGKRHSIPWYAAGAAFVVSLAATIALTATGHWISYMALARDNASQHVNVGDYSVHMTLPQVLYMAGLMYILPAFGVATGALFLAGWLCDRDAAAKGMRKQFDYADVPAVKALLADGWTTKSPQ